MRPPQQRRKALAETEDGGPSGKRARQSRAPKIATKKTADALPTREDVLAFIAEHPGEAGKRELARAFGLKGSAKIELKHLLRDLAEEGLVEKRRKRLARPGQLPNVAVLTITGRDSDGELTAEPAEWQEVDGPVPKILIQAARGRAGPAPGIGDRVLARLTPAEPDDPSAAHLARVIKLLERRPETVLGVVRQAPGGFRIEPVEKKQQRELAVDAEALNGAEAGDLVSVTVTRAGGFGLPRARVLEVIGSMKSERAVSLIAIHAHAIPHVFPEAVLAEAKAARPATLKDREDWRDLPLVTIDPPDAKDHDDAVHAVPDEDPENRGGFIVTVAIADVAWYLRPGSAMDREALKRGNSVYFPDRVVPMLPERISNDLCSLREGEDRPALAVRMVFGADGRKRSHRFHRIMMRSAAKLSYAEAQAAFDGRPAGHAAAINENVLKPLWEAYRCLARGRDAREPLELVLPERKAIVGPDGRIDRIIVPERLESHRLIEEFMIQANVAAAETLERRKSPLVYRIHDAPSLAKLEALRQFLASIDVSLPKAGNLRPSQFNRILEGAKGSEHEPLLHEVVLRSQSQAEYSPENIGHFGLNLRRYAHFTSPIRRYADLIVHRALIRAERLGEGGLPPGIETELDTIAAEISAAERRAMAAERDTLDRLVAHWLADRIGATFRGRIAGVTRAGLFVKLDETGADGFVPISRLGNDYFRFDEARRAVVGQATGEMHRLGDAVEVRLVEAAPVAGALRFDLLSEGRTLPRSERRDDKRVRKSRSAGPAKGRGRRS